MKSISAKKATIALIAFLVMMQLVVINKTNPPIEPEKDFINIYQPPQGVAVILKKACYDCHSHHTKYPWYTNVAPISWWIENHIIEGRKHLNFSVWGDYSVKKINHKLEECFEEVEEGEMPLTSYTLAHREANLTEQERSQLVDWFKSKAGK